MSEPQFADPAVSRRKFDREIAEFRLQADEYRRRGWLLADAEFPHALVILVTVKTQPISILCGVWFDYSNYDAAPPSVRLVHPLTREPYKWSEVPTRLPRMPAPPAVAQALPPAVAQALPPGVAQALPPGIAQALPPGIAQALPPAVAQALPPGVAQALPQGGAQAQLVVPIPLMQAYGDDDIPFLCVAGVREYHDHPAHSGDHWLSHRTSGAGRLVRLLEVISKYGLETIHSFEVQMIPKIRFRADIPPE